MAQPTITGPLDKFLWQIDNKWNEAPHNNELVLVFKIGEKCEFNNPQLFEVMSLPRSDTAQRCIHRSFTPNPITYIDCTCLKFCTEEAGRGNPKSFVSLLFLSNYLKKCRYVKILIITTATDLSSNPLWILSLLSCPAVHILHKFEECLSYFGLVVITQKEKCSVAKDPTAQPLRPDFRALRMTLIERLKVIKRNLLTGNDTDLGHSWERELQLHFLDHFISTEKMLILELDRIWDDRLINLIHIPSSPGYNIAKFCQQHLKVSWEITSELLWEIVRDSEHAGNCIPFAKELEVYYHKTLTYSGSSLLDLIIHHYTAELRVEPKRKFHVQVALIIWETLELSQLECTFCDYYARVMALAQKMDFPVDTEMENKFRQQQEQLELLSNVLVTLERDERTATKSVCNFEHFHERIKSEIIPVLSKYLANERDDICTKLQLLYMSQTEDLIRCTNGNMSRYFQSETERHEAIDMLTKDLELLETLECDTSSTSLIQIYKEWTSVSQQNLRNILQVETLEILEEEHYQLEACLSKLQQEYILCRNHSALKISAKLKDSLEDWKEKFTICNEVVWGLSCEVNDFGKSVITSFQKTKLNADLNLNTIKDTLVWLHIEMASRYCSQKYNTCASSIIDEMDFISKLLLNQHASEAVISKVQECQGQLESFLGFLRHGNKLACSILQDCLTSLYSTISDKLDEWNKCLSLVIFLNLYVTTFEYQSQEKVSQLAACPIVTDDQLFLHLRAVLPKAVETYLNMFQFHVWDELKSLAVKLVNQSAECNVEFPQKSVCLISGNYVKFSTFCCMQELSNSELKEIRIVAREVIFIDADFHDSKKRELEVILIAPCVAVVGNREINLDGMNIEDYIFESWYTNVQEGENGLPGKPGGNAGHFHIICKTIRNAPLLRVNCRGGNGSRGQNGGNGRDGADGRDGNISDLSNGLGTCEGKRGEPGGNGGDGGKGGHHGFGGSVAVCCYGSHEGAVKVSTRNGERGKDGEGGSGGRGGKNGNGYKRENGVFWGHYKEVISCETSASDGNPGVNGNNSQGQKIPKRKQEPASLVKAISDFRHFSMTQRAESAKQLMEKIEENLEMSQLSPQLFANDLFKLEAGHETSQIISEHSSFQERLLRYSRWKEENEGAYPETQYVLSLLYALSVSKVLVLKSRRTIRGSMQGPQVINIKGFFDAVAERITCLETSHLELDRRNALQDYQQHLEQKCEITQKYISETVLPAIKNASKEIQAEIGRCLDELKNYESQAKEDLHLRCKKYYEYVDSVEKWQIISTVLTALGMASEIACLLSSWFPPLSTVGSIIKVISGRLSRVVDKNTPDAPSSVPKVELPSCLKVTSDFVPEMRERGNEMARQIDLLSSYIETHTELQYETSKIMEAWRSSLKKFRVVLVLDSNLSDALTSLIEMKRLREENVEALYKWRNSEGISQESKCEVDILLLQLNICNCSANFSNFNIAAKLDLSGVTDPQVRSIKKRQIEIYEMLMPLVKDITEVFGHTGNEHSATSAAGRKVKSFHIHKTLRDLKDKMSNFFKDMKSEKMLMESIHNFEETVCLLNDLYDMMEQFEESKIFSDALHALTTQHVEMAGSVSDPELKNIISKIYFLLKANIFLLDYNEAVKAFKQWVFPFANKYLPSEQIISLDTDIVLQAKGDRYEEKMQKWIYLYVEKFEEVRAHIDRYQVITLDFDSVVFTGRFSSATKKTCPPFFIWKWNEFGESIGKLLSGEEIQLRADVKSAALLDEGRRGAVKFKSVQLTLNHKKGYLTKEQKELNKILKGYTVTMTHSGISYYRVFEQCFVISGNKQEYCYSFDQSTRNVTYEKSSASSSDYFLSPFTLWNFKLNNVGVRDDLGNELQKFVGQVSLQLEGDGWYVDEKAALRKGLDKDYLKGLPNHYELIEV